jgi:pantothenate kinase
MSNRSEATLDECFGRPEQLVAEAVQDDILVEQLLSSVDRSRRRFLLGIAGPPGAGKSTVAATVEQGANARRGSAFAVVAPMDGFHLSNATLDMLGLRSVKGAPETFDVQGFVHLVERVRHDPGTTILWPAFDRSLDETVPDAIAISPTTRLVVIEGNYLLLDRPCWRRVRPLLDEAWYVEAPRHVLRERLRDRAMAGGDTAIEAVAHVNESDLRNAELVATTRRAADRLLSGL